MDTSVNMADEESFGIEVIIQEGDDKKAPSCPHGMSNVIVLNYFNFD